MHVWGKSNVVFQSHSPYKERRICQRLIWRNQNEKHLTCFKDNSIWDYIENGIETDKLVP